MAAAIRRIAKFLGRTLTDNDVTNIADHCSIVKMRENDKVNVSYWQDIGYVDFKPNESHFINQGRCKHNIEINDVSRVKMLTFNLLNFLNGIIHLHFF